jgi:hypothetical protein
MATKKQEDAYRRAGIKHQMTMQAQRLASQDYYWSMDPDRTAVICRIDLKTAAKLRKTPAYLSRIESLKLEESATISVAMEKEADRLTQAFRQLVPLAVMRLEEAVQQNDQNGIQAAREILDRDGRKPKVSRIQTTIEDKSGLQDVDHDVLKEFQPAKVQ